MRKRIIAYLISVTALLALSGCYGFDLSQFAGLPGLTAGSEVREADAPEAVVSDAILKDLEAENTFDALLNKHGRFSYAININHKDGTTDDWSLYMDEKRYVSFTEYGTDIIEENEAYGCEFVEDGQMAPYRWAVVGDFDSFAASRTYTGFYQYFDKEEVISEEVKDGLIYLDTSLPLDADVGDIYESNGYSREEVEQILYEYVIDEASLDVLKMSSYIVSGGERILNFEYILDTDCEEYVPDQELLDGVFGDDVRTETIITDAGTAQEKEYTQTVTRGSGFKLFAGDDYYKTLYADPDCVTTIEKTDKTKDLTVYLKRKVDYAKEENWAYFGEGEDKAADLFLICPTVDVGDEFVMSLDDTKTKEHFLGALNMERGIYEGDTRMYAPYYRQGAMKIYSMTPEEREPYLEYAYDDISEAFHYYLDHENNDRPIVLAGFSQGADMCYRLLEEYFDDETLYDRLVAVYAIGWPVTEEMTKEFPQIKPAQAADDTGVVVSFDCEAPEVTDTFITPAGTKAVTINPLNWKTDSTPADPSENLGACFTDYDGNIKNEEKGLCGCYIDEERGIVKVPELDAATYPAVVPGLPEGAYHIYDYQFFFRNLEQNVHERVESYLNQ
ncbi:MAG: DUF3089 domain-containing protein [Lachnospiraceae bacterium]|nr:DUF3089 domain-containing protein [Lachnospiraceae bacterium]